MPATVHVETAQQLLTHEGANVGSADLRAAAAGRVYASLFLALAPVVGPAGLRALLARSFVLTQRELPTLRDLPMTSDRPTSDLIDAEYLVARLRHLEPIATSETATHLYATLFELMSTFIGEELVLQILRGAFPELRDPPSASDDHPKETKP
jgi:hypothetical protein